MNIEGLLQTVRLFWEEAEQNEMLQLYDVQPDGSGRLDWAAAKEAFMADVVKIKDRGPPGVFPNGDKVGLTRDLFQPNSVITVIVSLRRRGKIRAVPLGHPVGHAGTRGSCIPDMSHPCRLGLSTTMLHCCAEQLPLLLAGADKAGEDTKGEAAGGQPCSYMMLVLCGCHDLRASWHCYPAPSSLYEGCLPSR